MLPRERINSLLDPLSDLLPRGGLSHSELHSSFVHGLSDLLSDACDVALGVVTEGLGVHLGLFVLEGGGLNTQRKAQRGKQRERSEMDGLGVSCVAGRPAPETRCAAAP